MIEGFRHFFQNARAREYLTLILISITFESLVVLLAKLGEVPTAIDPWILVALGLAAFRGGRAVAFNTIFEWLRKPFTKNVEDSSGAGSSVEPAGEGVRKAIGALLCCPICAGTWVSLVLFSLLVLYRPLGLTAIYVLAAAGIAEILHWISEVAEWHARAAREEAGTAWILKNRGMDFRQPVGMRQAPTMVSQASEPKENNIFVWQNDLYDDRVPVDNKQLSSNGN